MLVIRVLDVRVSIISPARSIEESNKLLYILQDSCRDRFSGSPNYSNVDKSGLKKLEHKKSRMTFSMEDDSRALEVAKKETRGKNLMSFSIRFS